MVLVFSQLVTNPNYSDKGEKKFETGKTTSGQIDSILSQGKTLLKITRQGEGKETGYNVEATAGLIPRYFYFILYHH